MAELRTFRASDGYIFYYRRFASTAPIRARLIVVHGIRSHGGWYLRSAESFARAGIDVLFLDRRGAGLNTARRGDAPSFRRLLDDVAEFAQSLRADCGWLPLFLCGISWGGKLAVGLPYRKPGLIDGLVLLCPGLVPKVAPAFPQRARIALARIFRPDRSFPIPLNDPPLFTSSADWQKYIEVDPYGLRSATARFLFSSFSFDIYLRRARTHVSVPTFIALAERDRIIDNEATRHFASFFASEATIVEYPGSHHTLEFEATNHPWFGNVLKWIEAIVDR